MLTFKGQHGEYRLAIITLIVSLTVLLSIAPNPNCVESTPQWVLSLAAFTFTFAFIWLLVLFFERGGADRPLAMVYGFTANAAISFIAWGLCTQFVDPTTSDKFWLNQSSFWIPFWIIGALTGTDFYTACGGN